MSKIISYSLFKSPIRQKFEIMAYIRNFYWNSRMNSFIYPDFQTHLEISKELYREYNVLFDWLVENNSLKMTINENSPDLCEGMFWRMKPIFKEGVSHVLCRDADAITTYREAQKVQTWIESDSWCHAILDNPSHSGLMGGMVGFDTARFKAATGHLTWESLRGGWNLTQHGSDQNLLNSEVLPKMEKVMWHWPGDAEKIVLPGVDPRLWESNLCCRHIGSPGVVEMETIRFFNRMDIYQWKFDIIEELLKYIFHWKQ